MHHADQARWYIGEPRFHLATRPLLPQHDGAARIVAYDVVNQFLPISMPITASAVLGVLDMACSLSLGAPRQLRWLAGQEHGRTIPLTEVAVSQMRIGGRAVKAA